MNKKKYLLIVLLLIIPIIIYRIKKETIYSSINLLPFSDITKDRGIDAYRELIYKNENNSSFFYSDLVKRIESCNVIKNKKCLKYIGLNKEGDFSKSVGFSSEDIVESTIFTSPGFQFTCIVSNGGKFVIVILLTK